MVNPLLLLPLLNASTPTTNSNECYPQRPPGEPQLVSTTYVVCTQAINRMAIGHALNTPVAFGHSVKVGHKLPDYFIHKGLYGACVVRIDMDPDQQDTMTWRDIITSASDLRDQCVSVPPHLGGEGKAGPRQLLDVTIYGLSRDGDLDVPLGLTGVSQS